MQKGNPGNSMQYRDSATFANFSAVHNIMQESSQASVSELLSYTKLQYMYQQNSGAGLDKTMKQTK